MKTFGGKVFYLRNAKECNLCIRLGTLIHGIKAIQELTRTKIHTDVIDANSRKVCYINGTKTRYIN